MRYIPIAKPIISDEEITAVQATLKSGMIAQGETVKTFERRFSEYIGLKHSVAVSNGTSALDIALKALKIKAGDEVITTPFTFIATSNSILFQGAKPVFADIDENTFNICPESVIEKITSKTKAILGVHLFGHPFDVKAIKDVCDDHGLTLVEDCAQAHGAEYKGKKVGGFGSAGCFSFYPTKNMTTGEGGIITTNDDKVAKMCGLLRSHGEFEKYVHTILGYNCRMTNIQAAIGLCQLTKLNEFNDRRINNAEYLDKHLKSEGLVSPHKRGDVKHVYHQYAVKIEDAFPLSRAEFIKYLQNKGIGSAIHYPIPIFNQPLYQKLGYSTGDCPVASEVSNKVLSLPVHPALTKDDLRYIIESINNVGE